jgi:hypothetical protein
LQGKDIKERVCVMFLSFKAWGSQGAEREDEFYEEIVIKSRGLSLYKTTDNIMFIPLPCPATLGPTSPLQCLPFSFLIFNPI